MSDRPAGTNIDLVSEIADRLKKTPIGQIISEENLHDMTKAAVHKAFFEAREVTNPRHTGRWGDSEPKTLIQQGLLVRMVEEFCADETQAYFEEWLKNNDEQFKTAIKAKMDEILAGVTPEKLMTTMVNSIFDTGIREFNSAINMRLANWAANNFGSAR